LVDAHAHLTDERFAADVDAAIERAGQAGVARIVTCAEDVASSERAVALAERYDVVRAAVGIHPHRAASCNAAALARIQALAAHPRVVAVGEIGIDLSGRSAAPADQERALLAQLELASEAGLPVCVHVRGSGPVVRSLIDRVPGARGYVHCYSVPAQPGGAGRSGTRVEGLTTYSQVLEDVNEWTARGFFLSFAGTLTYPRSDPLRAAAAALRADRLLVETDAPALAPQPQRGRRNEPAFIAATYEAVARARGTTAAEIAARVRENAASLFGGRW